MKEAIEEFGTAMICCIIGLIVIIGLAVLISKGGIIAQFANAYADYFYSSPETVEVIIPTS